MSAAAAGIDTQCVVTVVNQGVRFWLRGSTWAFHLDRANIFADTDAAFAAIRKAQKFMVANTRKRLEVWSLTSAQKEAQS